MTKPNPNPRATTYFPIVKHWKRLKPLFNSPKAEIIWRLNMRDYAEQRASSNGYKYVHDESKYKSPSDYDSCDWRYAGRIGRHPEFWNFVCHSACHWVADLCLYVATEAYPETPWRIITQRHHSTVWNGDEKKPVLFDVNFLALEVSPFQAMTIVKAGRFLKPGQILRPYVFSKGYFSKSSARVLKTV